MKYRFARERPDYSDLSSGRVFQSLPGRPAFPIRLASEVFQRCAALLNASGAPPPYSVYDPCCGAAYQLGVLTYLHWELLREVLASDIDPQAAALAGKNLALLSADGIERRVDEIADMLDRYGKESHAAALASANVLRRRIHQLATQRPIPTRTFTADALDPVALRAPFGPGRVDIVFTDVPHGRGSRWTGPAAGRPADPLPALLDALLGVVSAAGVVAIACDKGQKAVHAGYQRIEAFQIGRRRIAILQPARAGNSSGE